MDWQEEKDELLKRNALAQNLGGADKIERQHRGGRLTVRERIDQILDKGSVSKFSILNKKEVKKWHKIFLDGDTIKLL